MAGQTLFWDSRIRSIAVMLPALGAVVWMASEVSSENYLWPLLGLGAFMALVFFTVFVKTIRFESAVLCALLFGYIVGNRGFAELSPFRPIFPGELGLALIIGSMCIRFALTRELPDMSGWLARVIIIFLMFGAVRLAMDYQTYRLDAMRDSAMVYYSLYFFFGRQLVTSPASKRMMEYVLGTSIVALAPIAMVERFDPDLLISNDHFNLLFQKDDLLTTFAAVGVFILYTRPDVLSWMTWMVRAIVLSLNAIGLLIVLFSEDTTHRTAKMLTLGVGCVLMFIPGKWMRRATILFFIVFIVSGVGRASVVALIVGSIPLLIAGRRKFLLYPVVALALGLTVLAGITVGEQTGESKLQASVFMDKMTSIVDYSGEANYSSDYGELKANTNEFRRRLWESFVDDTTAYSPAFGRGFGYDFISHFEETFQKGGWQGLRSAHNFYVTLYGRMGLIGLFVFGVLTIQVLIGGVSAGLGVKAGLIPLKDLAYWCGAWAILMSSAVGVVLEGPVGGIVFWIFLGVAVETSKAAFAVQQAAAASRIPRQEPLSQSRALTYGAT